MRRVALAAVLLLGGCMHGPVDTVGPSFASVRTIRDAQLPPLALGDFTTAPDPKIAQQRIAIRGSTMRPPKGDSFAGFLRATLAAQLAAAGRLDPKAPVAVTAVLTANSAGENMASGRAVLAATFTVRRDGAPVLTRAYEVENRWKSEFIGAIAIPEAFSQYNALYGQLVYKLLADPAFIAAVRG